MKQTSNYRIYHLINFLTYQLTKLVAKKAKRINESSSPIWVTGMFRSGTSLTTNILMHLGVDLGPKQHLLRAKGERKRLNPDGFFENYLFMDFSLYIFHKTNSWGDNPPDSKKLDRITIDTMDYKDFIHYSIVAIHDDRISNLNKLLILRKYYPANLKSYLKDHFTPPFAIKNPHFAVLVPILQKEWPDSKFLVVFRSPDAVIDSAKQITKHADYSLYICYYSMLKVKAPNACIYFSYDHLIQRPHESITALARVFQRNGNDISSAVKLIRPGEGSELRQNQIKKWPEELTNLYTYMLSKAINRSV
jgi:flagellin-specific chaperone FliS